MKMINLALPLGVLVKTSMRRVKLACTSAKKERLACFFVLFAGGATSMK